MTRNGTKLHECVVKTRKLPTHLYDAEGIASRTCMPVARVIELADAGYLPHWRIDNRAPLFVLAEVRDWIAENLSQYCKGAPLPTKVFLVADRDPCDRDLLPKPLRSVPGIRDISDLITCRSGVYFLMLEGEIVYVGQAVAVATRVDQHASIKQFDQVLFLPWPKSDLSQVEGAFIRLLKPPLNFGKNGRLFAPGVEYKDAEALAVVATGVTQEVCAGV